MPYVLLDLVGKTILEVTWVASTIVEGWRAEWDKWQPESGIELVFVKSFQGAKAYDGHAIVKCLC